jgi:ribosomal protein S18 acetylase RimI-like enzyme
LPRINLTLEELDQIKALEESCSLNEGIALKLNWNMLRDRKGNLTNDYLFYADEKLVGFLGLYHFGSVEIELTGMVHPDYRRLGIFSQMFELALKAARERHFSKLLLICPNNSSSGKAFITGTKGEYSFSEHYLERKDLISEPASDMIKLRLADRNDYELLIHMDQIAFEMSRAETEEFVNSMLDDKNDTILIAELDGRAVGKMGLGLNDDFVYLFGFSVLPEFRGHGFGRDILQKSIYYGQNVLKKSLISLEVTVTNDHALNLYISCGFVLKSSNDYYLIALMNQ